MPSDLDAQAMVNVARMYAHFEWYCGGCSKKMTGLVRISGSDSGEILLCDPCLGDLHRLLDKVRPEDREGVPWA